MLSAAIERQAHVKEWIVTDGLQLPFVLVCSLIKNSNKKHNENLKNK
jgi:hypothetical protein